MNSVEYFNNIADKWNVIRSDYFEEKLKYKVLSKVDIKNKVVADLGCGSGFISLALASDAALVFSVDNSINMLKVLKKSAQEKVLNNVYPFKSSLTDISLFDESLDAVFINMALHHIKDAKKAISEMYRMLKKGGTVVISDVKKHNGEWAREEMFDEWLGFSNEEINGWLKETNFKNTNIENTDLFCKGYSSKGEYTKTGIFIASAIK
ncbi:Methyltransferase domain-containing protein [Clostridium acidisoli DSM 12555]|uniref:Methyltransferase domain-containing protein n=1 Tax=Clostridium acidisoli DSM 12555 TaxID=1121291 RepID=A0A1W1XQG2_9CLOT|nr:class I SAM-dependent methyltransferase [Clostridium acidisoli]SMC25751.1 Methyltransferase domain-containing protein [Clostridium acidisoli DSM 12555]